MKVIVKFNNLSKTGLWFNIRQSYSEISHFFWLNSCKIIISCKIGCFQCHKSKSLCQKLAIWFISSSPPKFQPPIPSNMVQTFEFLFELRSHFPYKMKKPSNFSNFNIIYKFLMQTSFYTNYPWHHVEFLLNLCLLLQKLANFSPLSSIDNFPKNRQKMWVSSP